MADVLSPEESSLTNAAARHAWKLHVAIAAIAFAYVSVAEIVSLAAQAAFGEWGPSSEATVLLLAPIALLMSILSSWSAVWSVLGSGRWMSRLALSLVTFHVATVLTLGVSFGLEMLRSGMPEWREMLAMVTALSYAFAGQICVSMILVWLFKLFRYRLLYFDQTECYPHPREVARSVPVHERSATTVVSGRLYLADIFALTSLIAFYLAGWYPIVVVALDDDRMFGAPFLFFVVLLVFATSAAVGLLVVFFPLMLAMLDHRGKRFQTVCQSILLLVVCAVAGIIIIIQQPDDEIVVLCLAAVVAFFANQIVLYLALHKPSRWFRFRLVRVKV
jgi:hypothetical protein